MLERSTVEPIYTSLGDWVIEEDILMVLIVLEKAYDDIAEK